MNGSTQNQQLPNPIIRFLPILGWLPRYNKAWLMVDIIAGLSVWELMVPQSLGYADISGVPVQSGMKGVSHEKNNSFNGYHGKPGSPGCLRLDGLSGG